ncbi:C2H2 conidiation transcription factor [Mucor ambiguus]|uniref:C2H2 conidiation transcription factor n=1 Tax=Mucor ambiguus TaxID=91626 RepID=A0A0C9MH65_9FUNG|nr:C2H2 conidiation transcription factor [Mucor ambiguus]
MSEPNKIATSTSITTTTKLPSIQSMLEGISLNDERQHAAAADARSLGHRRHLSEHSAFTLVQKNKAPPLEPKIEHIPNLTKVTTTSTLSASPPDTVSPTYYSRLAQLQHPHRHSHHHHPQQHSPRNLHSRSFSDYTHPYPTCSPPRTTGTHLAPLQHRRAVSTNTLDLILQPLMQRPLDIAPPLMYPSSSTSSVTTNSVPDDNYEGYHSDETTHSERSVSPTPATTGTATKSSATSGKTDNKYSCPYCSKGFSRPSSLRIHTYSHTGERPFECPEAGCSRKFSVQSNMRRHLRVHRLGRPLKRNGGLISPADRAHLINKPLAAKPTTTASSNWIGVTVYPS